MTYPDIGLTPWILVVGFLAPLLGLLAKAVPIIGGVAAGYSAYQQIQQQSGALVPAPVNVPLLPSERARRALARPTRFPTYQQLPSGEFVLPGELPFRRRRMNVLNSRALRRSIRRVKGFSRFASRVGAYTAPGRRYRLKGFGRKRVTR